MSYVRVRFFSKKIVCDVYFFRITLEKMNQIVFCDDDDDDENATLSAIHKVLYI